MTKCKLYFLLIRIIAHGCLQLLIVLMFLAVHLRINFSNFLLHKPQVLLFQLSIVQDFVRLRLFCCKYAYTKKQFLIIYHCPPSTTYWILHIYYPFYLLEFLAFV